MENEEKSQKINITGKRWIKGILIVLGGIIGITIIGYWSLIISIKIFGIKYFVGKMWMLITMAVVMMVIITSFPVLFINLIKSKGNKKLVKWMVVDCVIVLLIARGWLTKAEIIPNWFNFEILCPKYGCNIDKSCSNLRCSAAEKPVFTEDWGCVCSRDPSTGLWKPIIYLYPTTETEVRVQLGNPERLSHTYPKYNPLEGRNVIAQSNGDLQDLETGRGLYALYWEGISYDKFDITEGFVVKGEDTIPFLEEKLAILGLNKHEAEEFIIYRLPQMENNKRNLIRFETMEEINKNMPLNITPVPDSVIRIMMDWKVLDEYVEITEQQLSTPERTGFVVVERGGSKLD